MGGAGAADCQMLSLSLSLWLFEMHWEGRSDRRLVGGRGGGGVMAAVNRDEGVVGVMGGVDGGGVVSCVLPGRKVLASPLSNINEAKNSIMQMSCNGAWSTGSSRVTDHCTTVSVSPSPPPGSFLLLSHLTCLHFNDVITHDPPEKDGVSSFSTRDTTTFHRTRTS